MIKAYRNGYEGIGKLGIMIRIWICKVERGNCKMKTNDRQITDLMQAVDTGLAQLPDFQRSWVWDDGRIKSLIASVIHRFPVGGGGGSYVFGVRQYQYPF